MVRTVAVAVLLVLFASGGGSAALPQTRSDAWGPPHVLTIADGGDADTLNPHLSNFATVANLSELTMAWLLRWNTHNELYPELATAVPTKANGGISADGLSITYHLRKGVRWSDGAPFNAADVLFSVAVINNPANHETTRFDQIESVRAPDDYTVIFRLKHPYSEATLAFFSSCCANPPLLPKHILGRYPTINDAPYNDLPVGIGPFVFARWDRGKQIVLEANRAYWRGRPKLQTIVYKIEPDRDALYADFAAHKIDLWYQFSGAYLPRVRALPGVRVWTQPSYAYGHYDFNLTRPILADVRVRRALRLALNRNAMVRDVLHGVGVVQDSALPPAAPYFSPLATAPYDPAAANALLDQAGWKRGADGIREKDGRKLRLRLVSRAGAPDLDRELAMLATDWQNAGVGVTVDRFPSAKLFGPSGVINGGDWDVATFAWAADPLGDYSGIYGCAAFPPAGSNDLHWCNTRADAAMNDFLGNYDAAQRTADVATAMRAFVDDVPSIVAYVWVDLFAYDDALSGYRPNNVTPFDNMMDVDI